MGPDLWELFEDGKEDDEVAAIIRLGRSGVLPKNVRVVTQFSEIITVRMKRGNIPSVSSAAEVASMIAGDAYLGADVELETVGLPELSPEVVLPTDERRPKGEAATGRSVVVGVVDWGFDFAHPDFRNKDGSSRIVALWDQRGSRRPGSPDPFGYGIVHIREAISRALKAEDPYAVLGYHPADADTGIGCHGTHVASIAAGSGGEDRPAGIAPEADLVFVHNAPWDEAETSQLGDSVTLLEGIDFISRTAGGRPWVINLSMGRHGEQHDGSTLIEQGLDAAIRSAGGRAVCLSAGNYFDKRVHASGQLRPTQERTLVWEILDGKPTYNQLEFWYSWQDKMELAVRSPDGTITARVKVGERAKFMVGANEVGNVYHRSQEPNNLDNHITVYLYKEAPAGAWEITLIGTDVIDGRYHAWIERDVTCPKCQSRFRPEDADAKSTTGTICNGRRTIAVGAYDNHDLEKRIAHFSSVGPTRDGRLKPDLAAPGVAVLAARSAPRAPRGRVPPLTRMNGTSMAAPHVTGTVALMFEAAPRRLRIEETHNLLLENTKRVSPHEETPDRFGIGLLDVSAAVEAARTIADTRTPFKQTIIQTSRTAKGREADSFEQREAVSSRADGKLDKGELAAEGTEQICGSCGCSHASRSTEEKPDRRAERESYSPTAPADQVLPQTDATGAPSGTDKDAYDALLLPYGHGLLSTAQIYDALAFSNCSGIRRWLEDRFKVVALPSGFLTVELCEADLLLKRGDGDLVFVSVIVSPKLKSIDAVISEQLRVETLTAGKYVQVWESHTCSGLLADKFACRIADDSGRVPEDQLVLRLRKIPAEHATPGH
jgi:subtilisin family serine protease